MQLSKQILDQINNSNVEVPSAAYFNLPEKVLQFGTGVLLRGLPDFYIDKANKQKIFNGKIVVVKSTDNNSADAFDEQDNLYTLLVRGIDKGKVVEENIINASISRVIAAKDKWDDVLQLAVSEDLQLIISNTTEVGIQLMEDDIHASPPVSFPGKLLAVLYRRYTFFNGDINKGLVIIPTELIVENGSRLLIILKELAGQNKLETDFINWLANANEFCNSLVDRIVPGKLNDFLLKETENKLGYTDELMIMSEAYNLWAIETKSEKAKAILSFSKVDNGVVIAPDISVFRELKLRLLNGAHTFSCSIAHLAGFTTVKEAMSDSVFIDFITNLMYKEIAVAITNDNISIQKAKAFAASVLDRFRNPYIEHKWLSITLQNTSKMAMRNAVTLMNYYERYKKIPSCMALGFAGYLLFTKPVESIYNKYYGMVNQEQYLINDDKAAYYYSLWKNNNVHTVVTEALSNTTIWNYDLTALDGFVSAVENYLVQLMKRGVINTMQQIVSN